MSDYQTKTGTLKEINKTKEEIISEYINLGNTIPDYYNFPEDTDEFFQEILSGDFYFNNNKMYQIIDNKVLDDGDLYELTENTNGTITYLLKYYDGGCGFNEALDCAFSKNIK